MSYRRILIGRWSRRDRLAILVVAAGVAFLCGTALLVIVAGGQTTALAAEYGSGAAVTTHPSVDAAVGAAPENATVVPFALARGEGGRERYVLARPDRPDPPVDEFAGGTGVTLGTLDGSAERTLEGDHGRVALRVTPRGGSPLVPASWYVANASTVERLGTDGAFVIRLVEAGSIPTVGVPLRTALAFFTLGTREALTALSTLVVGSGVLIGVVVHSVTRMTIREREATIRTVRATGAQRTTILALFGVRASLLSAAGAALGYAAGVIGVNAAVSAAVFAGLPTSLSPTLTPAAARVIAPILLTVVLLGGASGVLAAVPVVRGATLRGDTDRSAGDGGRQLARLRSIAAPTLLDGRTAVPTAATLAAFVAFVVLVGSMAGVIAPLSGGAGATVTEPGSVHPIASTVPATYADALRDRGIAASPELLLFEVQDGRTYTIRGAEFGAFASVTDAQMVAGDRPATGDEAVIGADLARTMDVEIGDRLTLGGTTRPGLARVEVVGVFAAPGPFDDQLVVPLSTARGLAGKPPGTAQFIRAERLPDSGLDSRSFRVTDVRVPASAAPNATVEATVVVENRREDRTTATVPIAVGDRTVERNVTLDPGGEARIRVAVDTGAPGEITVSAGEIARTIRVGNATMGGLTLGAIPERGPPNATLLVRVRDGNGDPVANATVTADGRNATTNDAGVARVSTGTPGELSIRARAGDRTGQATMRVAADATRRPIASLAVRPESPDLLTRPTATATLSNPWSRPLRDVAVAVAGPGGRTERAITLDSGATRAVNVRLPRQPPGRYEATLHVDGEATAVERFQVTGDERVAAALATGGRAGTSGIGRAVETAFGNLRLVFGTVLALAAGLTVGGTTATFARAVHGRREAIGIHRATGASPGRVLRIVLGDALRIGTLATLVAIPVGVAGLRLAGRLGYLTVFGVRIQATGSPTLLAGAALGGLSLTLVGAGLASASLLRQPPSRLVHGEPAVGPPAVGEDRDE